MENLSRPITTKEIEVVIKNVSSTKMASLVNSKNSYKEKLTPILYKLLEKIEEEKTLLNIL